MRLLLRATLLVLLTATGAFANSVSVDFAVTTTSPFSSLYGAAIDLDSSGNIIVAGSLPFATIITAKYSPTGALIWQREFDHPDTREQASWVTVDPFGNIVVVGHTVCCSSQTPTGFVTLKYDPNGNLLWQDVLVFGFGQGTRGATDAAGNVYVTGTAFLTNSSGNTTRDYLTIKYDPNGVRLWSRQAGWDAYSQDSANALAVSPDGKVFVTGGTTGYILTLTYDSEGNQLWSRIVPASTGASTLALGPSGEVVIGSLTYIAGGSRFLLIKYDSAGNEVWSRTYPGNGVRRVVIDTLGNVLATGIIVPASGGYTNWLTMKLDAAGNQLWSHEFDSHPHNDEIPYAAAVGSDGAFYVTGQGGPSPSPTTLSFLTTVTIRYTAAGAVDWVARDSSFIPGYALRLGADDSVYILGRSPMTLVHYVQDPVETPNQPPVAAARLTPWYGGVAPFTAAFTSMSYDPDGAIESYLWDFGDGSTSTLPNPMHVYASAGTFSARLTVTDNGGLSASATVTVNVTAPTPVLRTTDIALSAKRQGSTVNVTGRVTVQDGNRSPVPGAVVSIQWTRPDFTQQPQTATTDASGVATFTTSGGRGTYTLSVTGVAKPGYAYSVWDSVTSAQITR